MSWKMGSATRPSPGEQASYAPAYLQIRPSERQCRKHCAEGPRMLE